ncbi:MAG: CoA transferase [Acidimicrobiales bacterium]
MLSPYRVLDLTDRRGWLCGFLLAQLGADVALAEPPGGHRRDAWHEAYNRGKRSVIAADDGAVAALAAAADVVVASGGPEIAGRLEALRAANPRLVTVAITPYGSEGPKAHWPASDLTLFAASGQLAVTGDPDRPPVRTALPQAWLHGCAEAAVGALVALHERERSGLGQHVDCSVQQAALGTSLPATLNAPAGLPNARRAGGGVILGTLPVRWVYPATDGHVVVSVLFGPMGGPYMQRLFDWIAEEGFCDEATRAKNWVEFALQLQTGEETLDELARLMDVIEKFTAGRSKAELAEQASVRRLLIVPVADLADVLANPQLEARGYWEEVDGIRQPGAMVKAAATPLRRLGAAPRPGAHDGALGWDAPAPLAAGGSPGEAGAKPLAGLKVLDFAWVAAMPLATRILAYWGATVVRVESSRRPDILRGSLGHRDDIAEQDNAITWHVVNAGKLGLALNLATDEGRAVARDLARWADVVTESFTPGALSALGLGYDDLRELNPSLVMLSSCVMGQTGPLRDFAGFGNLAAAVAGFFDLTGWPDRAPAGPYMAYTDYTSPRFSLMALLAALDHRRRTGEGQHLDFSQMEAATHFLAPALVELQRSGAKLTRAGNLDPAFAPHGVYPAAGQDRWVAVVCETDEQWRSLAVEMRRADLAELGTAERLARRDELDALVAAWTAGQDPVGVATRLTAHGVPAHHVALAGECLSDPQLAWRGMFRWTPHPYVRQALVDQPPYRLSRSPGEYAWAGPTYGQHAEEVLSGILGYDDDRITELVIAEALE